jgi:hypothetical protein
MDLPNYSYGIAGESHPSSFEIYKKILSEPERSVKQKSYGISTFNKKVPLRLG